MNLQFYLEKLFISEEFENFKKENPDAYFCSGFFTIDKDTKKTNKVHIDYFNPETNKMFSFQLEGGCDLIPIEQVPEEAPMRISDNFDIDFNIIEQMIEKKIEQEKIKTKIQKILLSLQKKDENNFLLGTVFISNLGMLRIKIDLEKSEIIEFEKKSFFDMMKIIRK